MPLRTALDLNTRLFLNALNSAVSFPGPRSARPGHRVGPGVVAVCFFVLDYWLAVGVIPSSLPDT